MTLEGQPFNMRAKFKEEADTVTKMVQVRPTCDSNDILAFTAFDPYKSGAKSENTVSS